MTLRLRCLRCGDWAEMDPEETAGWGLCYGCYSMEPGLQVRHGKWDSGANRRWNARWQRDMERHPTYKALSAALDALESTPHGTLVEVE